MSLTKGLLMILLLLSGCASGPDESNSCGTVAGYLMPDNENGYYRVVVTHLNGRAVISQPNYQLAPGKYEFILAELIDSPRLKVKLAARQTKTLSIDVKRDQRYHLAAKFNQDRIYRGLDTDYWQAVVWTQESHQCEMIPSQSQSQSQ